jgi:hypothetical protein
MPPSPFPSTDDDPDLEAAARALDGELRRTARFSLVGGRCFEKARKPSEEYERLARAIQAEGLLCTGDYRLDAFDTMLRPGLMDEGRILGLVVEPPERVPYLELTTFFSDGTALTSNGRTGALPERPRGMALIHHPDLSPRALLALHRAEVGRREERGLSVDVLRGQGGPLPAVARYLDAIGF